MLHHQILRQRSCAALAVLVLLLASCGDDSDEGTTEPDTTDAATSDTTDAESDDPSTSDDLATDSSDSTTDDDTDIDETGTDGTDGTDLTSDEGQTPPTTLASIAEFTSGEATSADGTTVTWLLSGDADELCFDAQLANADTAIAATLGNGVSECLRPADGLDAIDDALVTDVGTIDGSRRFGYVWGRASADVTDLSIVANDGTTTSIELLDGATGVQVFAYVGVIDEIAAVLTLDASTAAGVVDSEPIRDFLRTGPTYPTVPPITVPPVSYPTAN